MVGWSLKPLLTADIVTNAPTDSWFSSFRNEGAWCVHRHVGTVKAKAFE